MSYVFGATLALAGIIEQQGTWRDFGPQHPRDCPICRDFVEVRFHGWLQRALATQREEIRALWTTRMPMVHGRVIIKRYRELGSP